MAICILYNNRSDNNKLNKYLVEIGRKECIVKESANKSNLVLELANADEIWQANYLYYSTFNRYYYINDIEIEHDRVYITCHVDVLMSFNNSINSLNVISTRSSTNYDLYQVDNMLPIDNYKWVVTKEFPNGFTDEEWIIATAGKDSDDPAVSFEELICDHLNTLANGLDTLCEYLETGLQDVTDAITGDTPGPTPPTSEGGDTNQEENGGM